MQDLLIQFISKYITLNQQEQDALFKLDLFKTVNKGQILLKEGEHSKEGYFVLKGCIRVFYMIDGAEKTTAFYTEMEGLTPLCALTGKPSDYNVEAIEESVIIKTNTDLEAEMFAKFPKFETMCRLMSEELLAKQQIDFDEFKTSSPEQRYYSLLQKRPDLLQRVPLNQLASFLGISPPSLSRLRARITNKKQTAVIN